ncbi:MAG: MFS transporter [Gemmataceae bacterium]
MTPADAPADPARRRAMLIVFLVVVIDLLGFGIVLPLAPRYADDYLAGTSDLAKGLVIGAIYSCFSLMQFVFSPVWGRVSDRYGRRPVLLVSLAGSALFYGLFGLASTLPPESGTLALALILLSRIGAGVAGASVSTAAAVIADCTPPERRAKGMALIGAAFGLGFTFGPLIAYAGLEVFQAAHWAPGAVAGGLSALALALAVALMPETVKRGEPRPGRELFSVSRSLEVLRQPAVGPLVLLYFLVIFAFANFEGTLALFTKEAFRLNDQDNFLVFAYVGLVLMVAQGGVYRPLAGRRTEFELMALGVAMLLIGLGGLAAVAVGGWLLAPSGGAAGLKPLFYLGMTAAVVGFAFVNPSVSALISRRADPTRQGEVLGVNQSFAALGRILGPFLGSVVFWQHPSRVLPYALAVVLLVGVVGLLPKARATGSAPTDVGGRTKG